MALKLYNTLTRRTEELKPLDGDEVRMYTCGPTVYHFVHIGNFRTFIFQDILRRYILYRGFQLKHVMNITDVEDKIIANASAEGVPLEQYTRRYETAFLEDMEALRIQRPEIMPRATEHIEEMLKLIESLEKRGYTYRRDGSVYFRIRRFQDYGKLSRVELDGGAGSDERVDEDEYSKESPRDFVLWKARKEGEAYWESPYGPGRPGWHLECSAMSMKYLGKSFDIHTGGVDLIFPHHENEIAQSEGATGEPFVRFWIHAAHLIVEGQKMSKSLGNFYTLRDLLDQGCSPAALRYLLFSVHYRHQLNFTFDGIEQSESAIQRVNDFLLRAREVPAGRAGDPHFSLKIDEARCDFETSMDDDLNTSAALGALFELIREGNIRLERNEVGAEDRDKILQLFRDANRIFDVFQVEEEELKNEDVLRLIREREAARERRDFGRADAIREDLARGGILLEDTKAGTRWKRRNQG